MKAARERKTTQVFMNVNIYHRLLPMTAVSKSADFERIVHCTVFNTSVVFICSPEKKAATNVSHKRRPN